MKIWREAEMERWRLGILMETEMQKKRWGWRVDGPERGRRGSKEDNIEQSWHWQAVMRSMNKLIASTPTCSKTIPTHEI